MVGGDAYLCHSSEFHCSKEVMEVEKQFQDYLMQELREIKSGVNSLTDEFQEYKTAAAEKYATKEDCSKCKQEANDKHKGVIGWIIGAYLFMTSTAITLFTVLLNLKK